MTKQERDKVLKDAKRGRLIVLGVFLFALIVNIGLSTFSFIWLNTSILAFYPVGIAMAGFALVFFFNSGYNVRHWWKSVWGTEIMFDFDAKRHLSHADRLKFLEEAEAWVKSEIPKGDAIKINPWRYHFRRKSQAMMFKLTWQ